MRNIFEDVKLNIGRAWVYTQICVTPKPDLFITELTDLWGKFVKEPLDFGEFIVSHVCISESIAFDFKTKQILQKLLNIIRNQC